MTEVIVNERSFEPLHGKVVLVTGCSGGIGWAAVELLQTAGAKVIGGDVKEPPNNQHGDSFFFAKTDVADWKSLSHLFKVGVEKFGRLDHVFANAGIVGRLNLLKDEFDPNGELLPPQYTTSEINYLGTLSTVKLALHYMRKSPLTSSSTSSITITTSPAGWMRHPGYEYTASKSALLGLIRGMGCVIGPANRVPVRINGVAPGFTSSGLIDDEAARRAGVRLQPASGPATAALALMADAGRHGQVVYAYDLRLWEVEEEMHRVVKGVVDGCDGRTRRERSDEPELYEFMKLRAKLA